jgi:hypothetical protein
MFPANQILQMRETRASVNLFPPTQLINLMINFNPPPKVSQAGWLNLCCRG